MKKPKISGRSACWLLLMQEFDMTKDDKHRKANVEVEFLSQLHVPVDPITIDENFLDKHIFMLSTQNQWYIDIMN